jgi:hypothetical protein
MALHNPFRYKERPLVFNTKIVLKWYESIARMQS